MLAVMLYQEAVDAFGQVLELDPAADMSRAYTIACRWEIGQTNQAASLAKEFKNPSAKWAQWAQWANAKSELESGSISNATVRFHGISINFPTLGQLPNRNCHIDRKIDWKLLDQLNGAKAP